MCADLNRSTSTFTKLRHGNYSEWMPEAKAELMRAGVWQLVQGNEVALPRPHMPTSPPASANAETIAMYNRAIKEYKEDAIQYNEYLRRCDRAIGIINQLIEAEVRQDIEGKDIPSEVWNTLHAKYSESETGIGTFYAKLNLMNKRYNDGEDINAHFTYILSQNRKLGRRAFDDETLAEMMLNSLPRDSVTWETLTVSILANVTPSTPLKTEDVMRKCSAQHQRLSGVDDDNAMFAARFQKSEKKEEKSKKPRCKHCRYTGHSIEDCRKKKSQMSGNQTASGSSTPKPKKGKANAAIVDSDTDNDSGDSSGEEPVTAAMALMLAELSSAQFSYDSEDEVHVLLAKETTVFLAKTSKSESFIDSGCSRHLSPCREWFRDDSYAILDRPVLIHLGDASAIQAKGIGTLQYLMQTPNEVIPVAIKNTLHVPALAATLLSVSCLTAKDHEVSFKADNCYVTKSKTDRCVGYATKTGGGLYRLHARPMKSIKYAHLANTSKTVDINVLHRRLGHLGHDNVKRLVDKGMVSDIEEVGGRVDVCEPCIHGKQHRLPFPISQKVARRKLDIIHSDICGPFPQSIGGKRYFITFTDDHTRHVWVYLLRNKSEALDAFKDFRAMVENQTDGCTIKVFRTDGGGEYTSVEFETYLANHGIIHQKTASYNPEQNGLSEVMNRILVERMRSMLFDAGLSNGFWGEAIITSAYLSNRSPVSRLKTMTPFEAWTGTKPTISDMRPFGCPAFAFVPKAKRSKLESKTKRCLMLGYASGSKAYRLWDPKARRIVISRDVIFDERPDPPRLEQRAPTNEIEVLQWPATETRQTQWESSTTAPHPPSVDSAEPVAWSRDSTSDHEDRVDETDDRHEDDKVGGNTDDEKGPDDNAGPSVTNTSPMVPNDETTLPVPPHLEHGNRRRRRTEIELLGDPPDVIGPRTRRLPARYRQDEDESATYCELSAYLATEMSYNADHMTRDPQTLKEAMSRADASEWKTGIENELTSLESTGTFEIIASLPSDRKAVDSKFVFKLKKNPDGIVERHKVRLVAKGFNQIPGIDFDETFAPVVKLTSIRVLCALAVRLNLHFHHLDVETAFLNGKLDTEIYLRFPDGCGEYSGRVARLLKSLYGLRQASRIWNAHLDKILEEIGYRRIHADYCIYIYKKKAVTCFLVVYVDDMGLLSNSLRAMKIHKARLARKFKLKDLGPVRQLLGIQIDYDQEKRTLSLSQSRYIDDALEKFKVAARRYTTPLSSGTRLTKEDCPSTKEDQLSKEVYPYQSLIGTLMYAMLATRPDIAFAVGCLSKFSSNPGKPHWDQAIRTLQYLGGSKDLALTFRGDTEEDMSTLILGYTDSDWAGDADTRRSTSGYVFKMCGGAISWSSKLQTTPALSSTEAEYIACTRAAQEAIWLRQLLSQLGIEQKEPTTLLGDNQGAIALANNPGDHPRSKHIQLRYHFIRFAIAGGEVHLEYVPTREMAADGFTKGLTGERHADFIEMLGLQLRLSGSVES